MGTENKLNYAILGSLKNDYHIVKLKNNESQILLDLNFEMNLAFLLA